VHDVSIEQGLTQNLILNSILSLGKIKSKEFWNSPKNKI
jgi:hypothetical protein